LIIGSGELVNRLPEVLATEALFIDVYDVGNSPLAKSQFISNFFSCTGPLVHHHTMQANVELLMFLEDSNYDYYIYSSDALGIAIGNSSLSPETKSRVMPVRNKDYFALAGSKIALSDAANHLGLRTPRFEVANTLQELELLLASWRTEAIAKADRGGGGARVRQFPANHKGSLGEIDQSWLPVLVQEKITGVEIHLDAQFFAGKLVGWTYSKVLQVSSRFGPSIDRLYVNPPSLDFVAELDALANEAGLHSFANVTLIWVESESCHYLIEVDLRPNAWHQFGKQFGMDWSKNLINQATGASSRQAELPEEGFRLSLYPRAQKHAVRTLNLSMIHSWVWHKPGTWETRNNKDPILNKLEAKSIVLSIRTDVLLLLLVFVWSLISETRQLRLRQNGLRRFVASLIGVT
jgi:hypothetical protein